MKCDAINNRRQFILKDVLKPKGYIRGPFGSALKRDDMLTSGIPVYEQQHAIYGIRDFRFFINDEKFNKLKRFAVQPGDLIISCSGTVGKVSKIREDDITGIISQALLILRVDNTKINSDYLMYFFRSREGYNAIISRSSGSVQVNIAKREVIEQIPLNIPAVKEQEKIVEILTSIDDKIALNNKINDNLQQQAQILYHNIFDHDNSFVKLGKVINTTSGGTPSRKKEEYYENGSICWVKSKELKSGFIIDTEEKINSLAISNSSAKLLPAHSVLVAMYGATVGEYAIISTPMSCNQAICALIPNENYPYTYLFSLVKNAKADLINMAVGSAQQNISQILIKQLPVHVNADNIKKYHQIVLPLFQKMEQIQYQNKALVQLRDILLPKLMSGELDVEDVKI